MYDISGKLGKKLDKSGGDITGDLSVSGELTVAGLSLSDLIPIGSIMAYAGSSDTGAFLLCDGRDISRSTYASLFAIIGTTYGSGDGSTTFNLPDTRGLFLRGAGSQTISGIAYSGTLGTKQGDQMQGHRHQTASQSGANGGNVGPNTSGTGYMSLGIFSNSTGVANSTPPIDDTTGNGTPRTGSETRPANLAVNYIIRCR